MIEVRVVRVGWMDGESWWAGGWRVIEISSRDWRSSFSDGVVWVSSEALEYNRVGRNDDVRFDWSWEG